MEGDDDSLKCQLYLKIFKAVNFMLYPYYVHAKSLQSHPTLCSLTDCSLPGSSVHEIPQARTLEWVAMLSSSRYHPQEGTEPAPLMFPALAGGFFTTAWPKFKLCQPINQPTSELISTIRHQTMTFKKYVIFLKLDKGSPIMKYDASHDLRQHLMCW